MKEKTNWHDQEYELEEFDALDTSKLSPITQVYGFLFNNDKLCIVNPKRSWRLPGGKPEKNENWKETIIREAEEEADIELDENSLKLIGYIKVIPISKNCEKGVHYLLRVVGRINKINEQTEDIAEGLINERKFIDTNRFLDYCKWGEIGKIQIKKALNYLNR